RTATPGLSEERWYEINPSASPPALFQHGVVNSSSLYVWNGAISPDRAGSSFGNSMAMSVSTSGAGTGAYPAIQFVTKHGTGGPQSPLTMLVQSSGANVDFSCTS